MFTKGMRVRVSDDTPIFKRYGDLNVGDIGTVVFSAGMIGIIQWDKDSGFTTNANWGQVDILKGDSK